MNRPSADAQRIPVVLFLINTITFRSCDRRRPRRADPPRVGAERQRPRRAVPLSPFSTHSSASLSDPRRPRAAQDHPRRGVFLWSALTAVSGFTRTSGSSSPRGSARVGRPRVRPPRRRSSATSTAGERARAMSVFMMGLPIASPVLLRRQLRRRFLRWRAAFFVAGIRASWPRSRHCSSPSLRAE